MADLPIFNWTAGRASDVAAQILLEWRELARETKEHLLVYCNARHLQITERVDRKPGLTIEWVGDERNYDGNGVKLNASVGKTKVFDHVIIAAGYGLEKDNTLSYWRNDTLGQPSLAEPHRTYLVSGQGDGAMIEVLRLRISQYRQDRILDELIVRRLTLYKCLEALQKQYPEPAPGLFADFEVLQQEPEFQAARQELTQRLRRDTEVILRLKKRTIAELFEDKEIKIAFQNRLLIYLLYTCGGFVPTCAHVEEVMRMHGIPDSQVIRRHGTEWEENLAQLLSNPLNKEVLKHFKDGASPQRGDIHWRGGYFGFPGRQATAKELDDTIRQQWRKEYLPGPTELAALSLCTAIAGLLRGNHPPDKRLRVTLHRARMVGDEQLLQQCCEYVGASIPEEKPAAARTFSIKYATIGLSYRSREIIRSIKGVSRKELGAAMSALDLDEGSRKMRENVGFLMAIPIVQPEAAGKFSGPSPVAGVLYIDSEAPSYFIDDNRMKDLSAIMERFAQDVSEPRFAEFRRIRNSSIAKNNRRVPTKISMPAEAAVALEFISSVAPPRTSKAFHLNFDYVDFVPA